MARNNQSNSSILFLSGFLGLFTGGLIYACWKGSAPKGVFVGNEPWIVGVCCLSALLSLICIAFGFYYRAVERRTLEKVRGLSQGKGASPKEFLNSRNALMRNGDFTGIYIFHNKTRDMYYVGQSTRVVGRVIQHLTGHGNGDVYADYKYGDEFEINLVSLRESGYDSLDALERDAIKTYNAYTKGYNRTRGNRN